MKKILIKLLALELMIILPQSIALSEEPLLKKVPRVMQKEGSMLNPKKTYTVLDPVDLSEGQIKTLTNTYKNVTKDLRLFVALELMKDTVGAYSQNAILGNNLTNKPIKIEFKNLTDISPDYASFDALGYQKKGKLYIYINQKHQDAPPLALAALLSHEALHQDAFNSINEETYAWTMEAAVWYELSEAFPEQAKISHPLVIREKMLKTLFIKGNYTDKYIRKTIIANPGYKNLTSRSPGFEDNL